MSTRPFAFVVKRGCFQMLPTFSSISLSCFATGTHSKSRTLTTPHGQRQFGLFPIQLHAPLENATLLEHARDARPAGARQTPVGPPLARLIQVIG